MDSDLHMGTLDAITAISKAFEEALARLQSWRKIRKNRRSGESELQDSLEAGKDNLQAEYYKLRDEHGEAFEQGDEISRSSLFRLANDIQHTIVDVIAKAELVHGYNIPDLNPSDIWQKSEKIRKSTAQCMGELILRIKTSRAKQLSHEDNSAGHRGSQSSLPMQQSSPANNVPGFPTHDYGFNVPGNAFYPPPARYSTSSFPLSTQPEYSHPAYDDSEYDEPERVGSQTIWRMPSYHSPPRQQSPTLQQTYHQGLPDSLRIGAPAGAPIPSIQRPRPASVSMTGTGYISRVATASPFSEPLAQRPFSSAPPIRPGAQEGSSYGFGQEPRAYPDVRRATVGYTRPPLLETNVVSRVWSPESPAREQPWIPRGALYSPISPPDELLDISSHGHFRMPTPVNHGGQEFHHR